VKEAQSTAQIDLPFNIKRTIEIKITNQSCFSGCEPINDHAGGVMGRRKKKESSYTKALVGFWIFIACLILICSATGSLAKEKTTPATPSIETIHPKSKDDINQLLSRLSDEQVRQILIQQLEKSLPQASQKSHSTGHFGGIYRLESFSILFEQRVSELGRYLPQFFSDMAQTIQKVSDGEDLSGVLQIFLSLAVIIGLALAVERFCWRFSADMRERFDSAPPIQGWQRFGTAMMRILPEFLGIIVFSLTSGILFAAIPFLHKGGWRILFIAVMMVIVLFRLITLLSRLILSPHTAQLRLAPVSDATAANFHRQHFLVSESNGSRLAYSGDGVCRLLMASVDRAVWAVWPAKGSGICHQFFDYTDISDFGPGG
jgi:hypothetical protein